MKHSGPYQPKLVHEQPILYLPGTGGSVAGYGVGPNNWVTGIGTVTHPTPTNTHIGQFRKTRITSVAGTSNQELGIHLPNADQCHIWRGNATGRGGFYFSARFIINAIPATNIRFFCGLSSANAGACTANALTGHAVGLWCADTDAADLKIVTRDGATQNSQDLATDHDLTTGILYEFVMIGIPAQGSIVTQLWNHGTNTLISAQNANTNAPGLSTFMAPQIGLSNNTNNTGGDTALDIVSLYARPNQFLDPGKAA